MTLFGPKPFWIRQHHEPEVHARGYRFSPFVTEVHGHWGPAAHQVLHELSHIRFPDDSRQAARLRRDYRQKWRRYISIAAVRGLTTAIHQAFRKALPSSEHREPTTVPLQFEHHPPSITDELFRAWDTSWSVGPT